MKAVIFYEHGGPEVLKYEDIEEPEYKEDEVLIRVHAVSVNRTLDLEVRSLGAGWKIPMPHILGADPAGEVVAAGKLVKNVKTGDRVSVYPLLSCGECEYCQKGMENICLNIRLYGVHTNGGYAEYAAVPAKNLNKLADHITYEEAAAMSLYYPVAWNLLKYTGRVKQGDTVLIMAAGSGLGVSGIILAKHLGAYVIAAAGSDWKLEEAKKLGADAVINYSTSDMTSEVKKLTENRGVDVVYENIASPELWKQSIACLAKNGRLVTCGTHGGGLVELDVRHLYRSQISILGTQGATQKMVREVMELVNSEEISPPVIAKTFPLAEAGKAHEYLAGRDNFGRVVLTMQS